MKMAGKWTDEEFDGALYEVVREQYENNPAWVLEVPGIYEILAEHLNNDVLDYLEEHSDTVSAVRQTLELLQSDYPNAVITDSYIDGSVKIEVLDSDLEYWIVDQFGEITMHNGEWV